MVSSEGFRIGVEAIGPLASNVHFAVATSKQVLHDTPQLAWKKS